MTSEDTAPAAAPTLADQVSKLYELMSLWRIPDISSRS
jgi:hypothetical protein